jgi:hypothetical protein
METIQTIKLWDNNGKPKVIINDKFFLPVGMIKNQTGIGSNFNILIGSSVAVQFYTVDEQITDDMKCTKADTIVKSFTIELAPMLQQFALAAAFGTTISIK